VVVGGVGRGEDLNLPQRTGGRVVMVEKDGELLVGVVELEAEVDRGGRSFPVVEGEGSCGGMVLRSTRCHLGDFMGSVNSYFESQMVFLFVGSLGYQCGRS
jgi:hypothetical protein